MGDFRPGDLVYAPKHHADRIVEATFLSVADPDEAIEIATEGGTRKTDAAWVQWEDGTTGRVVYESLREFPADDPRLRFRRLDGYMLSTLEVEGSSEKDEFVRIVNSLRPDADWDKPANDGEATGWIEDAKQRGIIRVDNDVLVSITQAGRNRMHVLLA